MDQENQRVTRLKGYFSADPGNVGLACDLIDALLASSDPVGAETFVASIAPEMQVEPGIRFRLARGRLMSGHYESAANTLTGLIDDGVASDALWHDLAFCQLCLHRTDEAARTLDLARAQFGDSAERAIVEARVAFMDSDYDRGQAALDRALALAPDNATALGVRALGFLDAGRNHEAAAAASACLARYPDQHEALLAASSLSLWSHDFETSMQMVQRAIARHPNSGRALSTLGQLHMVQGDIVSAQSVLERAVAAMPDHVGTWHALAWIQLLQGQVEPAEASYRTAYELDRNFGETHGGLALIDAIRGNADEAEQGVRRALRLNPQSQTAIYAKSILLDDRGEHAEAERVLAELVGADLPGGMDIRTFARNLRSRFRAA